MSAQQLGQRELAEAACEALDMSYAGVDILRDSRAKPYVLEVNSIPAWKGLQQVSHIDVTGLLVEDFLSSCQNQTLTEVI